MTKKDRRRRYEDSERGKRIRADWHSTHRLERREAVRRHRARMRILQDIGAALRLRFPTFTAAGTGGAARMGGSPSVAG